MRVHQPSDAAGRRELLSSTAGSYDGHVAADRDTARDMRVLMALHESSRRNKVRQPSKHPPARSASRQSKVYQGRDLEHSGLGVMVFVYLPKALARDAQDASSL